MTEHSEAIGAAREIGQAVGSAAAQLEPVVGRLATLLASLNTLEDLRALAVQKLARAEQELAAARARIAELEAAADPGPDPTTVPAEPVEPGEGEPEAWSRYAGPDSPLLIDRPMRAWPTYQRPYQPYQLDGVLTPGGVVTMSNGDALDPRRAYLAALARHPDVAPAFGVHGDCRTTSMFVGGRYSASDPASLVAPNGAPSHLTLVGLTPDAHVSFGWSHPSSTGVTGNVTVFDVGIVGEKNSMAVTASKPSGRIILDGIWFDAHPDIPRENGYASALHINGYESLLVRRLKQRGMTIREHWIYDKSQREDARDPYVIISECNLRGGNRTGYQKRPEAGATYPNARPRGDVYLVDNYAMGFGWTREQADGGNVLTCWALPDDRVFFLGNAMADARYGCIGAEGQAPQLNWLNSRGFPIGEAHVAGNSVSNPRATRAAMSFGAVEHLFIYGDNSGTSGTEISLRSKFNADTSGIANGTVRLVGGPPTGARFTRWNGASTETIPASELDAMRV